MRTRMLAVVPFMVWGSCALAQPGDPAQLQFTRITHPNNPGYSGPDPDGRVTGRGSVGYEYRMATTEVPTSLWMEFFNTFKARADAVPDSVLPVPTTWGATRDTSYTGPGTRYRLRSLADAENFPVYGVSWRTSARFVNWLHNERSGSLSAIENGAYDTRTFGYDADGNFTDQRTHNPDAKYWIPTWDEWLKSAHWDPNKPDRDGWWLYNTGKDTAPLYGPPPAFGGSSENEANAGFTLPQFQHFNIPLMSYPTVSNQWGMLDMAGGAGEWTEEVVPGTFGNSRIYEGSFPLSGGFAGAASVDSTEYFASDDPARVVGQFGLRIASIVPTPHSVIPMACIGALFSLRRRRSQLQTMHYLFLCMRVDHSIESSRWVHIRCSH